MFSKIASLLTPRLLSLLEPAAPVQPVTYSPVPNITAFMLSAVRGVCGTGVLLQWTQNRPNQLRGVV